MKENSEQSLLHPLPMISWFVFPSSEVESLRAYFLLYLASYNTLRFYILFVLNLEDGQDFLSALTFLLYLPPQLYYSLKKVFFLIRKIVHAYCRKFRGKNPKIQRTAWFPIISHLLVATLWWFLPSQSNSPFGFCFSLHSQF